MSCPCCLQPLHPETLQRGRGWRFPLGTQFQARVLPQGISLRSLYRVASNGWTVRGWGTLRLHRRLYQGQWRGWLLEPETKACEPILWVPFLGTSALHALSPSFPLSLPLPRPFQLLSPSLSPDQKRYTAFDFSKTSSARALDIYICCG